jgi:hypothetical protein
VLSEVSGEAIAERRSNGRERAASPRASSASHAVDPTTEADDERRRKLRVSGHKKLVQPLASGRKLRLPIALSTLWKRRFPYVRALVHCIAQ